MCSGESYTAHQEIGAPVTVSRGYYRTFPGTIMTFVSFETWLIGSTLNSSTCSFAFFFRYLDSASGTLHGASVALKPLEISRHPLPNEGLLSIGLLKLRISEVSPRFIGLPRSITEGSEIPLWCHN